VGQDQIMEKEAEDESSIDADDRERNAGTGKHVTELGPHDVLLGRGTGPSNNEGNVTFRVAVEAMKSDYVSTPSRKAKNRLVRKTVDAIKAKNGRFLSKLRKSEMKVLGMSDKKIVYEVAADSVAIEKTKQAIRYVHYKKDANQRMKSPESTARTVAVPPADELQLRLEQTGRKQLAVKEDSKRKYQQGPSEWNDDSPVVRQPGLSATMGAALNPNFPAGRGGLAAPIPQRVPAPQLSSTFPSLRMPMTSSGLPGTSSDAMFAASSMLPPEPIRSNQQGSGGILDYSSLTTQVLPSVPQQLSSQQFARAGNSLSQPSTELPSRAQFLQAALQSNSALQHYSEEAVGIRRRPQTVPPSGSQPQDERLQASLQQGHLQSALQDEQVRSLLLADERYRQLLSSYLSQPPPR
jgi:hypothetical protein